MHNEYKREGPSRRRVKRDFGAEIKSMAKLSGRDIFPDVKIKKKRKKETKPRKAYDRAEDRDRPEIMKRMRRDGWVLKRVEPFTKGEFCLGDCWGELPKQNVMGWVEFKSETGKLSKDQAEFRDRCYLAKVKYWVVRLSEDGYTMKQI